MTKSNDPFRLGPPRKTDPRGPEPTRYLSKTMKGKNEIDDWIIDMAKDSGFPATVIIRKILKRAKDSGYRIRVSEE